MRMENYFKRQIYARKKAARESFQVCVMHEYKENLVFEYKNEREKLKKRLKYIEQQLDGIGIKDFELTDKERMRSLEVK